MQDTQVPLRDLIQSLDPRKVEITPTSQIYWTGWEIIADKTRQEITVQARLLGLRLPIKYRYAFSRVVAINGVTSTLWQERLPISGIPTGIPSETFTEQGAARKRDRAWEAGTIHRIILTIEAGESIHINGGKSFRFVVTPGYHGPFSVIHDIRELEMILAKLICIPG